MAEIKNVVVVGAGTMGSQIALQTAFSTRYQVRLVDSSESQLERARAQNQKLVARAVERGRKTESEGADALGRIATTSDLEAAVTDADLVVEAVFEDLDTKRDIFKRVDAAAPSRVTPPPRLLTVATSVALNARGLDGTLASTTQPSCA